MNSGVHYFLWMGTFYLLYLTYQDLRHNRTVDDRKNYLMIGASFMLTSHIPRATFYIIAAAVLGLFLNWYMQNWLKDLGEADKSTMLWVFYGFAIINPLLLIWFCILLAFFTAVAFGTRRIMKKNIPIPFYPVISSAFLIVGLMYKLY